MLLLHLFIQLEQNVLHVLPNNFRAPLAHERNPPKNIRYFSICSL
jgi:hypothetical protein